MHGEITFPRDHVDDFILVRQDNVPSYNFAAAVDDMVMEITDVVRGSDHLIKYAETDHAFSDVWQESAELCSPRASHGSGQETVEQTAWSHQHS